MTRVAFVAVALLCCRTAPAPAPRSAPRDWRTDKSLTLPDVYAKCAAEQPGCRRAFGEWMTPRDACAYLKLRCDEMRQLREDGRWMCGCDNCLSDAECGKGEYCGSSGPPCAHLRFATHCREGVAPKDEPPCAAPHDR